ncbi:DUF6766 family protein, partial [Rhizobiaceae sp. 2RAB30]
MSGTEQLGLPSVRRDLESDLLQMAAYVVLTAMLHQRGSAESRNPDDPDRPNDETAYNCQARNPV